MTYCDQLECPKSFPWRFADIIATETSLVEVMFSNCVKSVNTNIITTLCKQQLQLYFAKELTTFCLPLATQGTAFSSSVYDKLLLVKFGTTRSYKQIAISLGSANKSRAVGHACSLNKISIIVPCHRIVSSSYKLTGYAGGLETKEWLLNHEVN